MNRLPFFASLLAGVAILSGSTPRAASADIILISNVGPHTVNAHHRRAHPAGCRTAVGLWQVTAVPVNTVVIAPLFLDPKERAAILRARTLAHARALARRH